MKSSGNHNETVKTQRRKHKKSQFGGPTGTVTKSLSGPQKTARFHIRLRHFYFRIQIHQESFKFVHFLRKVNLNLCRIMLQLKIKGERDVKQKQLRKCAVGQKQTIQAHCYRIVQGRFPSVSSNVNKYTCHFISNTLLVLNWTPLAF